MRRRQRLYLSASLLLLLGLFGSLGPLLVGRTPIDVVGGRHDSPSGSSWLGTDSLGHDVLTNLAYGTRTSLIVGLIAGTAATSIGIAVGTAAGYRGGWIEDALMAMTNVILVIPTYLILVLVAVGLGSRSAVSIAAIIALTTWPWTARAVRAQVASVRVRDHVDTARLSGVGTLALIVYDVLGYMLAYLVMALALQISNAVLTEAALSLLGLGPSGTVSLGTMLHWALGAESVRTGAWWTFVPAVALLTTFAFALLALQSSTDEIYNPRLRHGGRRRARIVARPTRFDTPPLPAAGGAADGAAAAARNGGEPGGGELLMARGLTAAYTRPGGETITVNNVSLHVAPGEVLGIAGESGCGKSTLAALLSLTAQPPLHVLDGELTIAGRRLSADKAERPPAGWRGSVVSLLPQGAMSSLPPTRRIGDFAVDVIRTHEPDITRRDALDRAIERLVQLGLPSRVVSYYPHQVSGGMTQRVVTVLSTLLNPTLLVADEPTSALDVSTQRVVLGMLRELLARDLVRGVIVITHDLPILRLVADRVAIMYAGEIVEVGTATDIVTQPRHPYTVALLSSVMVPEPRLRGQRLAGIGGAPPDLARPPRGCRFHPRCPVAISRCSTEVPPAVNSRNGTVTCWLHADDVKERRP
jgi:peptide/nickel transport system ATP-binding protein